MKKLTLIALAFLALNLNAQTSIKNKCNGFEAISLTNKKNTPVGEIIEHKRLHITFKPIGIDKTCRPILMIMDTDNVENYQMYYLESLEPNSTMSVYEIYNIKKEKGFNYTSLTTSDKAIILKGDGFSTFFLLED
jgi:hypothetical protein